MVVPLTGLVIIIAGVVLLESLAPRVDPVGRVVEDVPALAVEDERQCVRLTDDVVASEIRTSFEAGGRISSTQVYQCPAAFDGLEVSFAGEVVGELLARPGGVWAQVNDDAYALETGPLIDHREQSGFNLGMTVWLPDGLHQGIGDVGRADRRGDVVLVRGTLLRADPDDGGGITLRADELEVLAPSLEIQPPFHTVQAVVAGVLAVIAVMTALWSRRVRRQ
jgi:hypothetical protein